MKLKESAIIAKAVHEGLSFGWHGVTESLKDESKPTSEAIVDHLTACVFQSLAQVIHLDETTNNIPVTETPETEKNE